MKKSKLLDQALVEQGVAIETNGGQVRLLEREPNRALLAQTLDMVRWVHKHPIEEDGVTLDWDQSRWSRTLGPDDEVLYLEGTDVEASPDEATKGCNTSFCFAGWALHLSGVRFQTPEAVACTNALAFDLERLDDPEGQLAAESAGAAILGLTEDQANDLFFGGNSLSTLESVIDDILSGAYEDGRA